MAYGAHFDRYHFSGIGNGRLKNNLASQIIVLHEAFVYPRQDLKNDATHARPEKRTAHTLK